MVAHPSNISKNNCYCCSAKNVSDQHHIIPVQYSGPQNGLTVPLCPTCHRNIHREGEYFYKNKQWGKYVNENNYPQEDYLNNARILANYIYQSKIKFESMEVHDQEHEQRNMIQISCSPQELKMAHILKKDLGFTSLEKMIKYLIHEKTAELLK